MASGVERMVTRNFFGMLENCRLRCFVSVAIVVCLLLTALAALVVTTPSVEAVQEPLEYRIGVKESPDTFNPFDMMAGTSWSVAHMMYEFLYAVGPLMEPYPQLAASHDVSEDNLTWTYHLVEDSYWHDGLPVTADDVVFTFNMIMDYPQECALMGDYLLGFDKVIALDSHTVEITLLNPKANMLSLIVPILPEHLWSKVRDDGEIDRVEMWDTEYFPDGPVGSGPFILKEYSLANSWIRLEAHKPYHRLPGIEVDSVNIDVLLFVIYKSDNAMVTALELGEIDVIDGIPPLVWESVIENPDIDGQTPATLILEEFGFNCASKEWRESVNDDGERNFPRASDNYETCNLTVRQACTMATDIPYITSEIHQGMAQEAYAIIPTATPFWHYEVPEEEKWHFDIEAAKAHLEPYYTDSDGDGIRENKSNPDATLEFEFYYIRSNLADEQTAEKMKEWWWEIGVKVNLHPVSEGILYNLEFEMEYDMFIWSWWPDVDPTWFLSVLTIGEIPLDNSDNTKWSDAFYMNPYYDQLWLDQQQTMDLYERQAIVHEMQQIVYRDCPYICLVYPAGLIGYRTDKYENFPDMEVYTGISPSSFWYYFEITPLGEGGDDTYGPENVDAGPDRRCTVNETLFFYGYAEDQDTDIADLNWTWTFAEPDSTMETKYGQEVQYNFTQMGDVVVYLFVTDPEENVGSDSLIVNVSELSETDGWLKGFVEDADSNPLKAALVDAGTNTQVTDADGAFSMVLSEGNYTVEANKTGYGSASADVTIAAGEITWANFTLSLISGTLEVWVYDSDTDEPIASAEVTISYGSVTKVHNTDDAGFHSFETVSEGTVSITATKSGYLENSTTATVTAGQTTVVEIYLDPEKEDRLNVLTIAAAALLILAVVAVAVFYLLRKKGKGGEDVLSEGTLEPEDHSSPPVE